MAVFRRVTPEADHREVIACTVLDGKAIYMTALGSAASHDVKDETEDRSLNIPHGRLPEEAEGYSRDVPEPARYLFLTKGQPHRRQIGRIADRINAMGTLRIYALKDWHVLQNASVHIRMRGQELDQIIQAWSLGRARIDSITGDDYDLRDTWVGEYTRYIEKRLLSIGAALDRIGSNSIGGIHYRINSSRYYVHGFKVLLGTLGLGNIDSWVSYHHFVDRGLSPAFDFVDNLGKRLDGLNPPAVGNGGHPNKRAGRGNECDPGKHNGASPYRAGQ